MNTMPATPSSGALPAARLFVVFWVLLAVLAGCGGGSSVPPVDPPPNGGQGGTSTVLARQAVDEDSPASSVQAVLPGDGLAELSLPRYAVRATTEVTVGTLPDVVLPTGRVAAGVRLLPDGLQLANSATLTLHVKGALDPARTLGFAIHAGVVTYHPVKVTHEDRNGEAYSAVDIPLLGFSDHGIVSNADPAVIAQAISDSTPPLDALYGRLSIATDAPAVRTLLADFFDLYVATALETATRQPDDPVRLETAMRLYLNWRDQLAIMDELYPDVNGAGVDLDTVNLLLSNAISANVDHWNGRCESSLEPADARRAVTAWLWAPAVYLDRDAPLRKTDLLDKLCMRMEILGVELDALLESDQARPLLVKTGLQVLTQPQRHDVRVRVRVRVGQVLGGSVTGAPAYTNAQGVATLTATVQGQNPALAMEGTASVEGFADVLDRTVRVFRPRQGGQPKLISGKKFTGVIKYYFNRTPAECRQGREPGLEYLGDQNAELFVAGDPFAYVVTLHETGLVGGGVPPADWVGTRWEYRGRGDFGSFGGSVFSIETASGIQRVTDPYGYLIAGWSMAFQVSLDDAQHLSGRFENSCQYRELDMLPARPGT